MTSITAIKIDSGSSSTSGLGNDFGNTLDKITSGMDSGIGGGSSKDKTIKALVKALVAMAQESSGSQSMDDYKKCPCKCCC